MPILRRDRRVTSSALTLEQAQQALAACDKSELELLRTLSPHECALVLEAKHYANARLLDGWPSTLEQQARHERAQAARADFEAMLRRRAA